MHYCSIISEVSFSSLTTRKARERYRELYGPRVKKKKKEEKEEKENTKRITHPPKKSLPKIQAPPLKRPTHPIGFQVPASPDHPNIKSPQPNLLPLLPNNHLRSSQGAPPSIFLILRVLAICAPSSYSIYMAVAAATGQRRQVCQRFLI